MQFALSIVIFLALMMIPVYPVYAQNVSTSASTILKARSLNTPTTTSATASAAITNNLLLKDKMATKEGLLRQRLARFKDQEKSRKAATISANLNQINQNYTTGMLNHLNTLSQILIKIEARLVQSGNSANTADASSSIEAAKKNISDTNIVLNNQLAKDYSISATNEAMLKSEVTTNRLQLRTDLAANQDLIARSRQAVLEAIESVAKALGGQNGSK